MLSSPVYSESHPRRSAAFASRMNLRDAAHGNSSNPCKSFNSFTFNGFPTLLRNGAAQPPCFHTVPDSFHRNGGVYPFTQSVSREGPLRTEPVGIPLRSNRNACIPFFFVPLRSLSSTTGGTPPPLPAVASLPRMPRTSRGPSRRGLSIPSTHPQRMYIERRTKQVMVAPHPLGRDAAGP